MVPNGWKLSTIEEISSVSSGGTPSRKNSSYWNGNIPWVTTAEVQFKIIEDTAEKITEEGLANSSAKLFPVDTILMAMYGQGKTRGQVAKLGIEASTNQACAAIILKSEYYVDYYYQFLISQYKNIREMSNSGGQENLSGGIVKSIQVPVPPLSEQKKIAQILSTWDKAITTTEQLLANSQQQKKALMQQLLTGKKRLLDKNGVRFSGDWNALNLGEILSKVSNGVTYDAKNVEGLPVTRIETISTGKVNFNKVGFAPDEENTRRFKLHQGDILYSHINSLEHIGRVAYFNDARPLYHGMNLLLLRTGEKHDSLYIYYLLGSELGKKYAKSYAKSAVNQASISTTDVKAFRFLIPNLPEQQKIAAVLSAADQEISALQQKLDALKQEKKALMQQLLTGKRRVKIDNKEVA
ncbi:restriction endonuclease subunit S [Shewanella algae]|uniref:restriction endonuclease subunit S n=1 Tax=Shewanella algae TaxID=38313 RepID=UPI00313F3463